MKKLSGATKLLVSLWVILSILTIIRVDFTFENIQGLQYIWTTILFLNLSFLGVMQIAGLCILFAPPLYENLENEYASRKSTIYEADHTQIPCTQVGWFQLPVLGVKVIKIINIWANKHL